MNSRFSFCVTSLLAASSVSFLVGCTAADLPGVDETEDNDADSMGDTPGEIATDDPQEPAEEPDENDFVPTPGTGDIAVTDLPEDVVFGTVERPFWVPPAFTGEGCDGERGVWGDVVQRALWFLNVNRSGPGLTHQYIQWRGDSHLEDAHIRLDAEAPDGVNMSAEYIDQWRHILDPDENGQLEMAGGFYDAGDFLKIGITSNYMAHTLGWTAWTFPEAFEQTGLTPEVHSILRHYADFVLKNIYIEDRVEGDPWSWNVVAYGHQVGGPQDHDCGWMPPELRRADTCPRMGYFSTHENPAADVSAGAAAALALIAWHLRSTDPEYATTCINHAIALYEFAKSYHGTTWDTGGLYQSESSYDDLAWAALWLYEVLPRTDQPGASELTNYYASHREGYLDDILADSSLTHHEPWLEMFRNGAGPEIDACKQDSSGVCWEEGWTHIWNSLRSGVFLKLAEILHRDGGGEFANLKTALLGVARRDSLMWVTGPHTDGGFAKKVDVSWGSGRYNSAGQLVALTFARTFPEDVIPDVSNFSEFDLVGKNTAEVLSEWARGQSEYLLGDNPLGQSYMMGYTDDYADAAHHAATHASIYGLCGDPIESKHVAYGALVSGPNSGDDHSDDRCDYGANEITIDYNAAFLGALAGNYAMFGQGQCPDPEFPPVEPPFDEFYTMSRIQTEHDCNTQVEITLVNETAHPPRFDPTLKYRYYVDLSELIEQGIDVETFQANVIHDNYGDEPAVVSELKACTLNTSTYYFEFSYPYEFWGAQVWLRGPRVALIEFGFGYPNTCTYDLSNDFSAQPLTDTLAKSPTVPAYSEGVLVWGAEPECDEPPKVVIPPPVVR